MIFGAAMFATDYAIPPDALARAVVDRAIFTVPAAGRDTVLAGLDSHRALVR